MKCFCLLSFIFAMCGHSSIANGQPTSFRMATNEVENFYAGSGPWLATTSDYSRIDPTGSIISNTTTSFYGATSLARDASRQLYVALGASSNPITLGSRNTIFTTTETGTIISTMPFTSGGVPAAFSAPADLVNLVGIDFDKYTSKMFAVYESNTSNDRLVEVLPNGSTSPVGVIPSFIPGFGSSFEARAHAMAVRCDGLIFVLLGTSQLTGFSGVPAVMLVYDGVNSTPLHTINLTANDLPPTGMGECYFGSAGDMYFDKSGALWYVDGGLDQRNFFEPVSSSAITLSTISYNLSTNTGTINPPAILPQEYAAIDSIGCLGDIDESGVVDFNDLNAVNAALGQTGRCLPEDLNYDGIVDFADYNEVLSNFGNVCN